MAQILEADNAKVLKELMDTFEVANSCNEQGIANLLAETYRHAPEVAVATSCNPKHSVTTR